VRRRRRENGPKGALDRSLRLRGELRKNTAHPRLRGRKKIKEEIQRKHFYVGLWGAFNQGGKWGKVRSSLDERTYHQVKIRDWSSVGPTGGLWSHSVKKGEGFFQLKGSALECLA